MMKNLLSTLLSFCVFFSTANISFANTAEQYDLVITNARIVDGTGNPWFRGSVAVKDGRIVRVGRFDASNASDSSVRSFGEGMPHPRGYGNNSRVLARYVRELKLITLEDAIRKMTSLPAQAFNLRDRGLIKEGFAADLVIFDENTIAEKATFEQPHQYSEGFSEVVVNGEIVFNGAKMTGKMPGQPLSGN